MFRLFLVDRIENAKPTNKKANTQKSKASLHRRNRRIFDRFDIDYKHLSLMNDQDILLVRDLSEKGFSTEVSDRGFKRMSIGDIYICRIRYLNEIYEAHACVRWKSKNFVGFELVQSSKQLEKFMLRLLEPIEIGSSLKPIDETLSHNLLHPQGMLWYHGVNETNVYIWQDDIGFIHSWYLEAANHFIKWDDIQGLRTGEISKIDDSLLTPWQRNQHEDDTINLGFKQFATDVFMAAQFPLRDQLIDSLLEVTA